ncbi:hypothetical protein Tco_0672206 [Tanacetum coccineum]
MATLKFADTHNLVAFLSKPTESDGFEQIVDFLNAHPIRYALTVNPTIYISCIEQFWSTAKVKTINGEAQLHGSAIPTDSHHIPTIIQSSTHPQKTQQPRKPKRKDTQVPQSSGPLAQALMETKSTKPKGKGVVIQVLGESTTTISSQKSQDKGAISDVHIKDSNINHSPSSHSTITNANITHEDDSNAQSDDHHLPTSNDDKQSIALWKDIIGNLESPHDDIFKNGISVDDFKFDENSGLVCGGMKRGLLSQKGSGGGKCVKEKNMNASNIEAVKDGAVPSVTVDSRNVAKEVVSPSVVDETVSKDKQSSLVDTTLGGNRIDVVVPVESIRDISERFTNTAYGFFLGKRVAYPVVANYVRNTWGKYGLV